MDKKCVVIGGGLAGVEAAAQLAKRGVGVTLYEMKPARFSPAHTSDGLAELVCSNSLKSTLLSAAAGLLKAEMEVLGSVCVEAAKKCSVPAGGALAVDRERFSALVTQETESNPLIKIVRAEVAELPRDKVTIVAAGPLVSDSLAEDISAVCGGLLSFFDAAAPIITAESIDMDFAFTASRYGRGGNDYINCPMDKEEYERFHRELVHAKRAELREFEKKGSVYEGCMPVEVMAARGCDTLRFGPLRPVGLRDPRTGKRPWAVLQMRRENAEGTLLNLVGFQTNLKFGEQQRVFSMIPALHRVDFVRYGVMHRNTFINSPRLLNTDFSMRQTRGMFFCGQLTGVEGYMESAASGIIAGINAARFISGLPSAVPPRETMIGALCRHVGENISGDYQPIGSSFGLLPALDEKVRDKKLRNETLSRRSLELMKVFSKDVL